MSPAANEILTVAVVDDEEALGFALERILGRHEVHVPDVGVDVGFRSVLFTSGEQLLEAVEAGDQFDLMLLDLKLPGKSGLDILSELNEKGCPILTVMITAYATFETAVQATKLGGYDFLAKPFTPEELRGAVRKAAIQLIINREARRLAEEKSSVRFNFISVLSHELKAPINAIEGYLKILREDESPERQHMVDRCIIRLDGMRKLIFDLLDLTRIESGQKKRHFTTVDLRNTAKSAMELLLPEARERSISMELCADSPVVLEADVAEMEIILNNLVSNAVKYNREGGTVTIRLSQDKNGARISVADTGIGLAPEESAKLFHEFVRIKNEDTVRVMGSGLGLSTVRKLAQMYGGDVTVKSKKGEGSVFTVTLHDGGEFRPVAAPPSTDARLPGSRS
jgi:two-component system, sensor histidine kinase and response regulator